MTQSWRPVSDLQHLRLRAQMLADIRRFFAERQVLEVETPLLCRTTGTDPNLEFFATRFSAPPNNTPLFLQTSPEFAMKRLLAAGSGSIYQVCKAFRNAETGRCHNPEFTILEWYRIDFSLQNLMAEVAELLVGLLQPACPELKVKQISYQGLFQAVTGLNPLVYNRRDYQHFAQTAGFDEADRLCADQHVLWLDFLFSHCVQPAMTNGILYLVYGYPAILSSLARISSSDPRITERFEVFINGLELGNGFYELADAIEQEARFDREISYRQQQGLPLVEKDSLLLAALTAGLPECSGVALGLDRLLMIAGSSQNIQAVLAFPIDNV